MPEIWHNLATLATPTSDPPSYHAVMNFARGDEKRSHAVIRAYRHTSPRSSHLLLIIIALFRLPGFHEGETTGTLCKFELNYPWRKGLHGT